MSNSQDQWKSLVDRVTHLADRWLIRAVTAEQLLKAHRDCPELQKMMAELNRDPGRVTGAGHD